MSLFRSVVSRLDRTPVLWLLPGVALLVASQLRWGLDPLAWISWLPFLRFARLAPSWRGDLALLAIGPVTMTLAVVKIITDPLPLAAAPMFGVPIGLFLFLPLVLFVRLRRFAEPRLDASWHGLFVLLFPAFLVTGELAQHTLTELANWGVAANTQLDDLALLQLASVTGFAGVSFVVYLVNAALEHTLHTATQDRLRLGLLGATAAVVLGLHVAGSLRLAAFEVDTDTARVAAVGTDAAFGGHPLPEGAELAAIDDGLERRTRLAAAQGAEVVVWNEAATLTTPGDDAAFQARWSALAKELQVEIVSGYVVPVQHEPLRYENVSVTFRPDGTATERYLKHHPVPGEPAVPGTSPLSFVETSAGRLGTAICYDGDFPSLGLGHARNDIDLLAIPSSDWRGIDPIHTEMVRLRAIEGGYSVLRSTRFGLSAGIDATGRMRGWQSAYDSGDQVLMVELPRAGTWTVYGVVGEAFGILCALVMALALAGGLALRLGARRVAGTAWPRPSLPSASARS